LREAANPFGTAYGHDAGSTAPPLQGYAGIALSPGALAALVRDTALRRARHVPAGGKILADVAAPDRLRRRRGALSRSRVGHDPAVGPDRVLRESPLQDEGRIAIPILTVAAGMASLGAIIFWLRMASESESIQPSILGLLFLTALLSWVFIHMMFALHYAHEYYAEHRGEGGSMRFPGGGNPNYWEFISISPSPSAPRRRYQTWP
jgi:hypothetical protein